MAYMAMEASQMESFSPSFTSYSIWIAIVYSHKKTSWNWCMSFLSWWCPWTLESVLVPFCGTQLLYEVHVEGVSWINWWPTKYTFILVYMSLDGHGSVAKRIVFSLFYLPQYLNSNCVFSQKNNILKSMHERFELVLPLDPLDVFFVRLSYCVR